MKEKGEGKDDVSINKDGDDGGTAVKENNSAEEKEMQEKAKQFFGGEDIDDLEAIAGSGMVGQMLGRTSGQVKRDRAANIAEELKVFAKQKIDRTDREIRRLQRGLKNHFDFSPDNTLSLVMAENVEAEDVIEKDFDAVVEIAQLKRKNQYWKLRYNYLFGNEYEVQPLNELL